MKSPLWILNSALALTLLTLLTLMLFMGKKLPSRKSLTPQAIAPVYKDVSKINLARIYESDLFNTYIEPATPPVIPPSETIQLPQPPAPKNFITQPRVMPEFLPPLQIDLKGVIFNSNSIYSRAIIAEKKTNQEQLLKIGDVIEDANLIYIGKNKAIFIRSNGQQETLFMNEEDAKNDPIYGGQEWGAAVERVDDINFIINAEPFIKQVGNLAQFLDMLDVTTAFEKGKSIGCRIGRTSDDLGNFLGLKYGDIVMSVNNIPTTSTADRVKIYKAIEKSEHNTQIPVVIKRQRHELTLVYKIRKKTPSTIATEKLKRLPAGTSFNVDGKQIITPAQKDLEIAEQTLSQADAHNNMARTFKKNDKQAMLQYGGRSAVLQR